MDGSVRYGVMEFQYLHSESYGDGFALFPLMNLYLYLYSGVKGYGV